MASHSKRARITHFVIAPLMFVSFGFVFPMYVFAEMFIDLTDGRRIVVSVDKKDIESISFANKDRGEEEKPPRKPALIFGDTSGSRRVWQIGPDRALKFPSDAAKKARDGDIVEIDAGIYYNDYATWKQNNLTIRGVAGMAHLNFNGLIPNKKAIWITRGDDIRIENIEFSGARVRETNGAGIRHEGGDLTLHNTFFHDNENSIMSGNQPEANIEVTASRFWDQKREAKYTHGIYIGSARTLTLIGNHFKGTRGGHQIKSRAFENRILYNRIEDASGGTSSRLIDLPVCGLSFVIGNEMQQAATSENFNAIGYGPEGCTGRNEQQTRLYVINNTFVNEAPGGSFVRIYAGGDVLVSNNLLFGRVETLIGDGVTRKNVQEDLDDRPEGGWYPPKSSDAINGAEKLADADGMSLIPVSEFLAPAGTRKRTQDERLDVGAAEIPR